MPDSYVQQLATALEAARQAGDLLREEFHRPGGPRGEGAHADIDDIAEAGIHRILSAAYPEYGYRGEELGLKSTPRDAGAHTWVVDPNDGTNDYLRGFRGSSVAIALLRNGRPVLGVVNGYCAPDSGGDVISWAEGCGPLCREGLPVERSWPTAATEASSVLVSTYADFKIELNARAMAPLRFRGTPSIAYRMATIAAGDADATVSLNAPHSWDFAAGHALLAGAGATLADARGHVMAYTADGLADCAGACYGGSRALIENLMARDWRGVKRGLRDRTSPFVLPRRGFAIRDSGLLSRAQGCLTGQLAGDSLGSLVEFLDPSRIAVRYPEGVTRLETGGSWGTIAGQPTDDSEMALALARSILRAGRYDAEHAARAYVTWYRSDPFDIGATTRTALSAADTAVAAGATSGSACRAAANPNSQSNGALMRVSPLGIAHSPAEAWKAAYGDAALTHPHPVCRQASALYAATVSYAIRSGDDAAAVYDWAVAQAAEHGVSQPLAEALRDARHRAPPDFLRHQGWVLIAFQNAFFQLLHASGPAAGVVDTVARGGDTDTNGAIAGALLGAVYGLRRLPAQWVDRVLTARPIAGLPGVERPRPSEYWPTDALYMAESLALLES